MKFEIKNRFNGSALFTLECGTLKLCVEAAIRSRADLYGADLYGADLYGANLSGADLSRANLSKANLSRANLSEATLSEANLYGADLSRANLSKANLSRADLSEANLYGADLSRAENAKSVIAKTRILPEGDLIGWKKVEGKIVKLNVPANARRSHAFGRKCRAEFVDVIQIEGASVVHTDQTSQGGAISEYRVGKRVTADSWDTDFQNECSHGIHFFITREEAEEWK